MFGLTKWDPFGALVFFRPMEAEALICSQDKQKTGGLNLASAVFSFSEREMMQFVQQWQKTNLFKIQAMHCGRASSNTISYQLQHPNVMQRLRLRSIQKSHPTLSSGQ